MKFLAKLVLLVKWLELIVLSSYSNSSALSEITEMKDQAEVFLVFFHIPVPSFFPQFFT